MTQPMNLTVRDLAVLCATAALLSACGGGSGPADGQPPANPGLEQRIAAAQATAQSHPLCSTRTLNSFYWEIGDQSGPLASGSVGPERITADTLMNIASASKWPFAAYVVEKHGVVPSLVPFLNFTSGYSNFDNTACPSTTTVAGCNNGAINEAEAALGTFHYQGGHMQQLAVNLGLGGMRVGALASELAGQIGSDAGLSFVKPLPEGGVRTSARGYATFLRKMLVGSATPLKLGSMLGSHAVCTKPINGCNASGDTVAALPENFHYSLGHWVEDDPTNTSLSNFAYSSAGKFGFYPWISLDRTFYGIIAREDPTAVATGEGYASLQCGRLIRAAWRTGNAQ